MLDPDGRPTGPRSLRPAHFELAPGQVVDDERCMAWVDALEDLAVRIVEAGGLSGDEAVDFGVAVREAVVNALRHGACSAPRRIAVSFRLAGGPALVVIVRDRGPGFDPAGVPDPCAPENLGRGSGRGVFYMRRFSDSVSFDFPARGGTVARLVRRLPSLAAAQRDPGFEEWLGPLPRPWAEGDPARS
jgi:serine/threonine-protein kinase RsbW